MAFSDYLHCEDCVRIHDEYVEDCLMRKVKPDWGNCPPTPGYKMIYVGEADIREDAGSPFILCGMHALKRGLSDGR